MRTLRETFVRNTGRRTQLVSEMHTSARGHQVRRGGFVPCTFYHPARKVCMAVHCDDVVSEGRLSDLEWVNARLQEAVQIKTDLFGAAGHLQKKATILNRIIQWTAQGIYWEPDVRRVELTLQDMGLDKGQAGVVLTPGETIHHDTKRAESQEGLLEDEEVGLCSKGGARHRFGEGLGEAHEDWRHDVGFGSVSQLEFSDVAGRLRERECLGRVLKHVDVNFGDSDRVCSIHGEGLDTQQCRTLERDGRQNFDGNRWYNRFNQATCTVVPPAERLQRRTTREIDSNLLLEDLWVNSRAPPRLMRRYLRRPRDVEVVVDLASMSGDVGWEDAPMISSDATKFRAVVARLNFLATDRPDIQFAVKEAPRRMTVPRTTTGRW